MNRPPRQQQSYQRASCLSRARKQLHTAKGAHHTLNRVLPTETARVLGVLRNFDLPDLLPQRRTIARAVLTRDVHLARSVGSASRIETRCIKICARGGNLNAS